MDKNGYKMNISIKMKIRPDFNSAVYFRIKDTIELYLETIRKTDTYNIGL
jgi:hypothetical protein